MIDLHLQQELRERFNPDGSMLRRQQLRMVEILLYIDKFCKENDIKYWLSSGTLLGAVRHGGFIPWDDDLDIEMLREDYLKFIKLFPANEDYALQTLHNDPNYFKGFAKVRDLHSQISEFERDKHYKYRGLYVDVFSLERLPRRLGYLYGGTLNVLDKCNIKHGDNKIVWYAIKAFQKCVLLSIPIVRHIFKFFTKELRHSYGTYFPKQRYIEDLYPLGSISFEGHLFPAPKDTDHYLKTIYGDYNRLPDLDSIQIHANLCIFKD